MYKHHPSIEIIKLHYGDEGTFSFREICNCDMSRIIKELDSSKNASSIPTKIIKINNDMCNTYFTAIYNNSLNNTKFPQKLKLADTTPTHKGGDTTAKKNYRPVSVLPTISKIFEKHIFAQIYGYFDYFNSVFNTVRLYKANYLHRI